MSTKTDRKLSPAHLEALAEGRRRTQIVDKYLTVIHTDKKRGRKRSQESIQTRMNTIDEKLPLSSMVSRLKLLTEREELNTELKKFADNEQIAELETQFIEVAKEFGEKARIPYPAWKALGVKDEVLALAGITR